MICFYHSDLDGRCAAAIVLRESPGCRLVGVDYGGNIPLEKVEQDEEVIVVDFFFESRDQWNRLLNRTGDVTWIDHHETAIEKAMEFGLDGLPGVRRIGESGCLLTWKWFHRDDPVPKAVELIDRWDLWTHDDDPEVIHFILGLRMESTNPASGLWDSLFSSEDSIASIRNRGSVIEAYEKKRSRSYVRRYAFETIFEGYRCLACNTGTGGSKLFDSVKDRGYDILITFVYDGEKYSVFLVSETIAVNRIAQKYGGGGHRGAAGFTCKILPFCKSPLDSTDPNPQPDRP